MTPPPKKRANAPSQAQTLTPRDLTWRHYAEVMDKFRKLCHSDKELFRQAEDRIKAKRVIEAWERQKSASADPVSLAKAMTDYVLDVEDERQVDELYRSKLDFRDRLCNALGKPAEEKWDVFFERHNAGRKVPFVVRQFELTKQAAVRV